MNRSNNKGLFWGVIIVVILVMVILLNGSRKSSGNVIKIGYYGPFTGPVAGDTGADIANGWKMAVEDNHVIGDKKVEVIYEDDGCDPQKATSAATKLLNVDKVDVLVSGVCSGSTLAGVPLAEARKKILFTPVSTTPKLTDAGDYVFRTSASSVKTAEAASSLLDRLGYKKVAILYEVADFTVGWKDAFTKKFGADSTHSIMATESVQSKDLDVKTSLLKITQTKPQAILFIFNSTVSLNAAIKQVADMKIAIPIIGNDYMGVRSVVENPQANGMYASVYKYNSGNPRLIDLLSRYEKTYHTKPSTEIYPALAYDGYNVVFAALQKCNGADTDCVKQALYGTKNFDGISGLISIDKNGDTEREFTLKKIQNGNLTDIQ